MWRCYWCGAEFEEPDEEPEGHFMYNPVVSYHCPECWDDDIEEIEDGEDDC